MVVSFSYAMFGPSQKPTDMNTQEDSLALYTDYFVAILLKKKKRMSAAVVIGQQQIRIVARIIRPQRLLPEKW